MCKTKIKNMHISNNVMQLQPMREKTEEIM